MKTKNIIVLTLFFTIILFSCTRKTIVKDENREYYEIKDADEFREKLNLYHFIINDNKDYYQERNYKKESEIIKLNISEETLLNMVSNYLYENDIFNEDLLNSIISVLKGEIREYFFSEINVFLGDINYGRFIFDYFQDKLYIEIRFFKAAGIDIYFNKRFFLNDSDINYKQAPLVLTNGKRFAPFVG
jgi:hypothetical protein